MADFNKEFLIRVRADIRDAVKDMERLTGEMRDQGKAAKAENAQVSGLSRGFKQLAAAAGAYISVQQAFKALRIADEYRQIQTQIRLATKATGDYTRISEQLYDISQRNGTALADTVRLFRDVARSARELGATNTDVLKVTEAIQQLAIASGADQTALGNSLRQFSQAMAAGVVRAEEFNSILENTPAVAERIARGLGTTVGQLRLAVLEGKVLSRDVFDALLRQAPEIAAEMAEIPNSIERSSQRLANSFQRFLGNLNEATDASGKLASIFDDIAKNLDVLGEYINPTGENKFNLLIKERLELQERIRKVQEDIARQSSYENIAPTTQRLLRANEFALERLEQKLAAVTGEIEKMQDANIAAIKASGEAADTATGGTTPPPGATAPSVAGIERDETAREQRIQGIVQALETEAETYGKTAAEIALYRLEVEKASQAQVRRAQAAIEAIAADREFEAANQAAIEDARNQALEDADLEAQLDRQAQRWQDLINPMNAYQRQLEEIERLYNAGKISGDTYAEATFRIQDAIEGAGDKAQETAGDMNQFAIQAARSIQGALSDQVFDILQGDFDGLADQFKATLDRMVADALAAKLAEAIFGDFGTTGEVGGPAGGFMEFLAAFFHDGGIAGQGGRARRVNPLVFANAPRLHSGGLAGLTPSEVPSILRVGEEVLRRDDPRHVLNGGGQGTSVTMNISTPDANSFRASRQQILHELGRASQTAVRRNG